MKLLSKKPYTHIFKNFPDITVDLSDENVDPHEINTFIFRHPDLAPKERDDNQTNDIRKLSIKTMSDYILKFGLTIDDLDAPPIMVTTDKIFNTISYIGEGEPPIDVGDVERGMFTDKRPATLKDLIYAIQSRILDEIYEKLITVDSETGENAFSNIYTIDNSYMLSLDPYLTDKKLSYITDKKYEEVLNFDDFLYFSNVSSDNEFVIENPDGFVDPSLTEILVNHTHENRLYSDEACTKDAIVTRIDASAGGGFIVAEKEAFDDSAKQPHDTVMIEKTDNWTSDRLRNFRLKNVLINPTKISSIMEKTKEEGKFLSLSGDVESSIGLNQVMATCHKNENARSKNYITEKEKVSIRYKARCYRLFKRVDIS